jgi:hypothetical protein
MRLQVSRNAVEECLVALLTEGHRLRLQLHRNYRDRVAAGSFDTTTDVGRYRQAMAEWTGKVQAELKAIFPTDLELFVFSSHASHTATSFQGIDQDFGKLYHQDLPLYLERLKSILDDDLGKYTDLPIKDQLHVEDIDSFAKVRDVNPSMVAKVLKDGYLDLPEDTIQMALEAILGVSFHKKDWGGEGNDLYTANVIVNGARRPTAFMLKGNGLKNRVMEVKHCGKNGDQVIRLFQSPADLFVIQFVGSISEAVIHHARGEVARLKGQGKGTHFLIMDGQDTARVLQAYSKL